MNLEQIRNVVIAGVVAAIALYELYKSVAGEWQDLLTSRSNADVRVFALLLAGCVFTIGHLVYERIANGR